MKIFFILNALFLLVGFCLADTSVLKPSGTSTIELHLTSAGKARYSIVYPATDTSAKSAAQELAAFLKVQSGGVCFEVTPDTANPTSPFISVGSTKQAVDAGAGLKFAPEHDEIELKTDSSNLFLSANQNAMNAVMAFLEGDLGCRFFTSEISHIPVCSGDLFATVTPRRETAAFRDRLVLTDYGLIQKFEWTRRNRVMRWEHFNHPSDWFCHTYHNLVPMTDFAKTPELFAIVHGKPAATMICPTHPENQRRAAEEVRRAMIANPTKRYFSIAETDGSYPYCRCSRCLAIIKAHGNAPIAAHLQLVNAAARATADRAPGQLVEFIIYSRDFRKVPTNIKLEPNVHMWYCANFNHSLPITAQPEKQAEFMAWRNLVNSAAIWEYGPDFSDYSHIVSRFPGQVENLKFYYKNHVSGIMMQEVTGIRGGDLQLLRAWVFAKLLWNPALDADQLAREYCEGAYGPAASEMFEYYNLVQAPGRAGRSFEEFYGDRLSTVLAHAADLFETALDKTKDHPAARKEIEIDSLPVRITRLNQIFQSYSANQTTFPVAEYRKRLDVISDIVERHNLSRISETASMSGFLAERRLPLELVKHHGRFEIRAIDGRLYSYPGADDQLAEGGKVTRQKCDGHWLVQWPLPVNLMQQGRKYQLEAEIRIEKASSSPVACGAGLYDETEKKQRFYATIQGTELSEKEYRFIKVGPPFSVPAKHKSFLYFSAPAESDIGSFYLNRLRLVPQK